MLYLPVPNTLVGKAAEQYQPKIFCLILNNQVALPDDLFILASECLLLALLHT
jgi:hypothetical protein